MTQQTTLHSLLAGALNAPPDRPAVAALVHRCHSMALAYLRLKEKGGSFSAARSGIRVDDMAFDAIADLFRRSPEGAFVEFHLYFRRVDPARTMSEDELLIALRRLVFSAVNHHVFRTYREQDPALSKVIRNLKLALKRHRTLFVTEQCGLLVIAPVSAECDGSPLPLAEPELLAPSFHERVSVGATVPDMLGALEELLREEEEGPHGIPLVDAALMIRETYRRAVVPAPDPWMPDPLLEHYLMGIIGEVIEAIGRTVGHGYVAAGKLTGAEIHAHLMAVRDILTEEFVGLDGLATSYFSHLRIHLNNLTEQEYRHGHRVILEYLARIAKRTARKRLVHEW